MEYFAQMDFAGYIPSSPNVMISHYLHAMKDHQSMLSKTCYEVKHEKWKMVDSLLATPIKNISRDSASKSFKKSGFKISVVVAEIISHI